MYRIRSRLLKISWIGFPLAFLLYTCVLWIITTHAPPLEDLDNPDRIALSFPRNFAHLVKLATLIEAYKSQHFSYLLLLFCTAYVYKQTFSIPGSVFLNVLAGAIFGSFYSFFLVCFLTGAGATFCYLLSKFFVKRILNRLFPYRLEKLKRMVVENNDSLFYFLLSCRLFPMTPNWFLNLASPVISIPLHIFVSTTFIGLMPYNFMCVQAGSLLYSMQSLNDIFTWSTILKMVSLALAAMSAGILVKCSRKLRCVSKD